MATVNEKMTAIADELRELSGQTGKLTLDAMASAGADANNEVITQEDLIAQLANALQGKSIEVETVGTVYVGTAAPSADIGNDGDIYVIRSVTA